MIRRPARSTRVRSSAASDVYKRQQRSRAPVVASEIEKAACGPESDRPSIGCIHHAAPTLSGGWQRTRISVNQGLTYSLRYDLSCRARAFPDQRRQVLVHGVMVIDTHEDGQRIAPPFKPFRVLK